MKLFTIGHSVYDTDYFINLIKIYNINCIVDVRSIPYSKYSRQYNKDVIKNILKKNNIVYIYMGTEFGARRESKELYSKEGYLDFEKVVYDNDFLKGVERIKNGLQKGYNIAFMCTEKEPEDCHRCILIGRYFNDIGYQVINIIDEKNYKTQNVIEQDLLNEYFPERNQISLIPDLNKSDEELIRDAYKLKNKKIGYRLED